VGVSSLGFATDLAILRLSGSEVTDEGPMVVVRTTSNPDYYWGNFILVKPSGEPGAAAAWLASFSREFPSARHVAIGVDDGPGAQRDQPELAAAGLSREIDSVLTTKPPLRLTEPSLAATMRPLSSPGDWEQQLDLRVALAAEGSVGTEDQLPFLIRQVGQERRLTDSGRACFLGAFVASRLVACLGIVRLDDGICRYQNVETRIEHRRQGLATALLGRACAWASERAQVEQLVIVADPDGPAIGLYRALGFVDQERQVRWQKEPGGSRPDR